MYLFQPAQEVHPLYTNEGFRKTQAQKYIDYLDGKVMPTKEELQLIPRQCYHEIQDICWWNDLTVIERAIHQVCHPFFSRFPNDQKNAVRVGGASLISLGVVLYASHSRNDKLVVIAALFVIAVLCSEMYRKKTLTKE